MIAFHANVSRARLAGVLRGDDLIRRATRARVERDAREAYGSLSSITRFETAGKYGVPPARCATMRTCRSIARLDGKRFALYGSVSRNARFDQVPSAPNVTAGPSAT